VQQVKYTAPTTNKLLLEAGFGTYISQWGYSERPGNPTKNLVRAQETQAQTFDRNGVRVVGPCDGCLTMGGNLKYRRRTGRRGTSSRTPGTRQRAT
jgi:hypothetical protein